MVDITSGVGQSQSVSSTNRAQEARERNQEAAQERQKAREVIQDEVQISDEAISRLEAEQAAEDVREQLAQQEDQSLGLDPNFDDDA